MTRSDERYVDAQVSTTALVLAVFMVLGVALAFGVVFGAIVRTLLFLIGLAAVAVVAYRTRLIVEVSADGVRVGRAALPWRWVDRIEVLEGAAMREAVGPGAHPTDFLRIRNTAAGLRVWLDDSSDPHRCWVASIRDPHRLRSVLAALPVRWSA